MSEIVVPLDRWITVQGPPTDSDGILGTYAIDTSSSNYDLYRKEETGWMLIVSLVGPQGDQGVPGLNWQGAYDSVATYAIDDAVYYQGSSYVAVAAVSGVAPSAAAAEWDLLAEIGATGAGVPSGGTDGQYIRRTASGSTEWAGPDVFVGEMKPYAGASSPSANWSICDGAAISRTTFAELFAVIGTSYGSGDGSTTFNLPDLRGRTAIGAGAGVSLTNRALGAKVGGETVALTSAQMPSHSHGGTASTSQDGAHAHMVAASITANTTVGGVAQRMVALRANGGGSSGDTIENTSSAGAHGHTLVIPAAGSNQAHENMQPSVAVNYLIKVA